MQYIPLNLANFILDSRPDSTIIIENVDQKTLTGTSTRWMDGTESRRTVKTCPEYSAEWTSELQGERKSSNPRRNCHRYQGKGYRTAHKLCRTRKE